MSLQKYIEKRDFSKTKEPRTGKAKAKKSELRFVVQRHHASHLHYDFRLEMEGVLKSWAVPKGPSLNPSDKRLAMMVEDHPYDYRTFEGEIPAGNYGGGVVHIFDEGTYEALDDGTEKDLLNGLKSGNLKFRMHGKILKGEFALVKIKADEGNSWLLIKHKDEYAVGKKFNSEDLVSEAVKKKGSDFKKKAKSASMKTVIEDDSASAGTDDLVASVQTSTSKDIEQISYKPMLAKLADKVFDDANWVYEKKLDGYRALAYLKNGEVKLMSRNGIDFSSKYQSVETALRKMELEAVIDGELVVEDKNFKNSFQKLQNYRAKDPETSLKYYVFDLLALNGHDIRDLPLIKRKDLLKKVISDLNDKTIIYSDHVAGKGTKLFKEAEKNGWEGIIGKDAESIYQSDKRSDSWLKFKIQNSQEAVIIGYSKPGGSRNLFGSLALGMYSGKDLVYIGNCGTGFNEESLRYVYDKMQPLITKGKPVEEKVHKERDFTWLKPSLVCEVTYSEWTADQHLRHPVFKGLREDKDQDKIVKEVAGTETAKEAPAKQGKQRKTGKPAINEEKAERPDQEEIAFGRKKVKLTNLNKLYWKKEGITKGQLIDYYREVADYILPYLKDKPLSLNRHPNGIEGANFFQKDLDTEKIPSWIKSAPLYSESNDKNIDYLICNDEATLLWMANLGCIEINPWLSKFKKPDNPLYAVLDLDPHDIDFKEAVKVAQTTKGVLDIMGITAFIKTSGSKGLHIFIPIGDKLDYEFSKNFINYLGKILLDQHPDTTSLERSPSKRKNKIYLDFLQNRRGQTIAAPYSARPKPGATVSTPLEWEEVNETLNLKDYTIFNTLDRIREKGDLWSKLFSTKNNLAAGLKKWKDQ